MAAATDIKSKIARLMARCGDVETYDSASTQLGRLLVTSDWAYSDVEQFLKSKFGTSNTGVSIQHDILAAAGLNKNFVEAFANADGNLAIYRATYLVLMSYKIPKAEKAIFIVEPLQHLVKQSLDQNTGELAGFSFKSPDLYFKWLLHARIQLPQHVYAAYQDMLDTVNLESLSDIRREIFTTLADIMAAQTTPFAIRERKRRERAAAQARATAVDDAWASAQMEEAWATARRHSEEQRERDEMQRTWENERKLSAEKKATAQKEKAAVEEKIAMDRIWREARTVRDEAVKQKSFLSSVSKGSRDRNIQHMMREADRVASEANQLLTQPATSLPEAERALRKMKAMRVNASSKPRL